MESEYSHHSVPSALNTKLLAKNLLGTFLILPLAFMLVVYVLLPEVLRLFVEADLLQSVAAWATALGSLFLSVFILAFPVFLALQGFVYFRDARALDQNGVLAKGSIAEKWVDESDNDPIYHVRYKYFLDLDALATVNKDIFQQLACGQNIDVILLENAPYISRLNLKFQPELDSVAS